MRFPLRCGRLPAACLMTMLLSLLSFDARAGMSMMADGEPGKGIKPTPSRNHDATSAPRAFSLNAPFRLDVMAASRQAVAQEKSWCTYRITAYAMRRGVVVPGDEICMSSLDLFGESPDVAEFHFLDRKGRELASAYGELVSSACGSCTAETRHRFSMYRR